MAKKIYYGRVITLDDKDTLAEAIVVEDGKIAFVGSHDEVQKFKDGKTLVMDFGHSYIYPGFMDSHLHGQMAAWQLVGHIDLSNGSSLDDYIKIMQDFVKKNPKWETYIGTNFLLQKLDRYPTAKDLDKISTTANVYMITEDKHVCCANTKVLNEYQIDANLVKQLKSSSIVTDDKGNPTGCFTDSAALRIVSDIKMPVDITRKGYIAWQRQAFSYGYTAVSEAAVLEVGKRHLCTRYDELIKTGLWKLRTYGVYLIETNADDVEKQIDWAKQCQEKFNNEYFKLIGIKVFADGVVEAHTAFLTEDYNDKPGDKSFCIIKDYNKFVKTLEYANKKDLLAHVHCIGNAATKFVASAMEEAQNNTKIKDIRNCICHLELVDQEDIEKMAKNHIVGCVAPLWVPLVPVYKKLEEQYIGKRSYEACKIKSFIDAGVTVAFHSDYPGCRLLSIPESIYRAVTRQSSTVGPESIRNPNEAITRKQALYCLTRNVAFTFKEEKNLGTIEVGKVANFTVFDTDFLNCKTEDIPKAQVINTIVDGEIVY